MSQADEAVSTVDDVSFGDLAVFRVVWSVRKHWADFKVYEIGGWGGPTFDQPVFGPGFELTIQADTEVHVEGSIKWDGCSNLHFDPCVHLCSAPSFENHIQLMKHLYFKAFELMGRELADPWTLQVGPTK